jgi:hypothetical protein
MRLGKKPGAAMLVKICAPAAQMDRAAVSQMISSVFQIFCPL